MTDQKTTSPATVAFVDIGTNSIRLLIVRIEANHSFVVLHRLKETVRLGENEFGRGRLSPDAIDRALAVLRQFSQLSRSAGVTETVAVATAATREAENQRAFLDLIQTEAGFDVHVISGMEEARLIHLGVVSGVELGGRRALCIDIGGGSTELSIGDESEHDYLNSLSMGAIRLTSAFLADYKGPVSNGRYNEIKRFVRDDAAAAIAEMRTHPFDLAFGSSGTVESLADIAAALVYGRARRKDDTLLYGNLNQAISVLRSVPLDQRRRVPGMNPARADIIIAGAAILDTLMEELHIRELRVSERALREGLLVDYLRRNEHYALVDHGSVRERSVLQLGRRCQFNEEHARTTARLARALFVSGAEAGLHTFGEGDLELLEYAALLHHIGSFLTPDNYQRHSSYLIQNADLLGFDQEEIALLSKLALFHRGPVPRKKDPSLQSLAERDREKVRILSMLLRLAENLDRSQSGVVREARLERLDGGKIALCVEAVSDWHIEYTASENQREPFERTFNRRLQVMGE